MPKLPVVLGLLVALMALCAVAAWVLPSLAEPAVDVGQVADRDVSAAWPLSVPVPVAPARVVEPRVDPGPGSLLLAGGDSTRPASLTARVTELRSRRPMDAGYATLDFRTPDGDTEQERVSVRAGAFASAVTPYWTLERVTLEQGLDDPLGSLLSRSIVSVGWTAEPGGTHDLDLTWDEGCVLAGVVVDEETGAPLPDARVVALPAFEDVLDLSTTSDELGRFRLAGLGEGVRARSGAIDVDVCIPGRPTVLCSVAMPSGVFERTDLRINVARAAWLSGVVENADGVPLAGRVLRAFEPLASDTPGLTFGISRPEVSTMTAIDGSFRLGPWSAGRAITLAIRGHRARLRLDEMPEDVTWTVPCEHVVTATVRDALGSDVPPEKTLVVMQGPDGAWWPASYRDDAFQVRLPTGFESRVRAAALGPDGRVLEGERSFRVREGATVSLTLDAGPERAKRRRDLVQLGGFGAQFTVRLEDEDGVSLVPTTLTSVGIDWADGWSVAPFARQSDEGVLSFTVPMATATYTVTVPSRPALRVEATGGVGDQAATVAFDSWARLTL